MFHKIRDIPVLKSLSYTVKGLQAVRRTTLLKRGPHIGVSELAVRTCSAKHMFMNH